MKKLIIIPAFNEAKNLPALIDEIRNVLQGYDYVIIDDGSTDDTRNVCAKAGFNAIHLPVNLGIGGAVQTGYLYAERNGYDIVIQVDGDGQHDPAFLDQLVSPIIEQRAQFTIGSRYLEKAGFQSSFMRRLGIRWLSFLLSRVTRVRITDVTSGFRAAGKPVIARFARRYPTDYPEPETICELASCGYDLLEIPVVMRERIHGTSSIRPLKAIYYMIKVSTAILIASLFKRSAAI